MFQDLLVIVVLLLTQWRITVELLRLSARHFQGLAHVAVCAAVLAFDGLVAVCSVLSFSEAVSYFRVSPGVATVAGAGALLYLGAATPAYAIFLVLRLARKQLGGDTDPGRRRVLNAAGGALMAGPLAVVGYGAFVERLDFGVREVDIPLAGLPDDLDGLRLLQLSDIHLSVFLSEAQLTRVIDAAIELRPHVAVVTGDLISSPGDPLDACIRQLARLKSDAGILACMGNHELASGAENYAARAGARAGIRFLRGRAQPLRFGKAVLNVAGVDYQQIYHKARYLRGAERLLVPGATNVLLSHNPDVFPVAAHQGYNLLLAGHTHGGQVTVEIVDQLVNPARFFTPYVHGLYRSGGAAAYVTRGIGTIGIPVRLGAPPEISVLRLRKA